MMLMAVMSNALTRPVSLLRPGVVPVGSAARIQTRARSNARAFKREFFVLDTSADMSATILVECILPYLSTATAAALCKVVADAFLSIFLGRPRGSLLAESDFSSESDFSTGMGATTLSEAILQYMYGAVATIACKCVADNLFLHPPHTPPSAHSVPPRSPPFLEQSGLPSTGDGDDLGNVVADGLTSLEGAGVLSRKIRRALVLDGRPERSLMYFLFGLRPPASSPACTNGAVSY